MHWLTPRDRHLGSWLTIGVFTLCIYLLSRSLVWAVIMLAVACVELGLRSYFSQMTPTGKFHFLQPWQIPDPATHLRLWGMAIFDGLLYLLYVVFAVFLALVSKLSGLLIGIVALGMAVGIVVRRYWQMRRQYRRGRSQDGSGMAAGVLYYVGTSDLSRRERLAIAAVAVGGLIVWIVGVPLWLTWFK